jgi:hypothetical protein
VTGKVQTACVDDHTPGGRDLITPGREKEWRSRYCAASGGLPPWGPSKITEDGRGQLRALGFDV